MVNQRLVEYIKTAKEEGKSDTEIRATLYENTFKEVDVNEAFAVINPQAAPTPTPPAPIKAVAPVSPPQPQPAPEPVVPVIQPKPQIQNPISPKPKPHPIPIESKPIPSKNSSRKKKSYLTTLLFILAIVLCAGLFSL